MIFSHRVTPVFAFVVGCLIPVPGAAVTSVMINKDPTQQYQKIIKQTLNQCNNIIQKEHKWKYINMNTTAPNLHATIKLHKQNTPIRPIINWKNAPTYELAKKNVKNTTLSPTLTQCI
jgi:hypothetical protein